MGRMVAIGFIALIGLAGCGEDLDTNIRPVPMGSAETMFSNGMTALKNRDFGTAGDYFYAIEQTYPDAKLTTDARLMSGYTYYLQHRYPAAIEEMNRFVFLHPSHEDAPYAYYLRSLAYFDQILDVHRDQKPTITAMAALQEVVLRFPKSKYAAAAQNKINICRELLAGKEMVVGRFYQKQKLMLAALGRYQGVVKKYETTSSVPEALHRIVEVYMTLGLKDQAITVAAVLGHNYPSSEWYKDSYTMVGGAASGIVTIGPITVECVGDCTKP